MPYHVQKQGNTYIVVDYKGKIYGKHKSRKEAQGQIYAIEMNEKKKK